MQLAKLYRYAELSDTAKFVAQSRIGDRVFADPSVVVRPVMVMLKRLGLEVKPGDLTVALDAEHGTDFILWDVTLYRDDLVRFMRARNALNRWPGLLNLIEMGTFGIRLHPAEDYRVTCDTVRGDPKLSEQAQEMRRWATEVYKDISHYLIVKAYEFLGHLVQAHVREAMKAQDATYLWDGTEVPAAERIEVNMLLENLYVQARERCKDLEHRDILFSPERSHDRLHLQWLLFAPIEDINAWALAEASDPPTTALDRLYDDQVLMDDAQDSADDDEDGEEVF